jgi:hypothetical protein
MFKPKMKICNRKVGKLVRSGMRIPLPSIFLILEIAQPFQEFLFETYRHYWINIQPENF